VGGDTPVHCRYCGPPGLRAVKELVPRLRQQYRLDLVVAMARTLPAVGITPQTARDFSSGVDLLLVRSFVDQKDVIQLLEHEPRFSAAAELSPPRQGRDVIFRRDGLTPSESSTCKAVRSCAFGEIRSYRPGRG